jgi:hypothetical protein
MPADPDVPTIARALGALAEGAEQMGPTKSVQMGPTKSVQMGPTKSEAAPRRAIARETWQMLARADRHYAAFADRLAELAAMRAVERQQAS